MISDFSVYSKWLLVIIMRTFCFLAAMMVIIMVESEDFVMPPQSINATLNSTAVFSCQTANISNHIWRINNTLTPAMSSTVDMTILEVFCSEDQDMSVVECGGRLLNRTRIFSDPALLRVQGLLANVTNLSVHSTTTSITLTWIPPFSLDITGVEPDFTHTVEVYNITSGDRQEVGVYENITDSTFIFTLSDDESQSIGSGMSSTDVISLVNPDPSDLFEFIVTAVNAVERGEPSGLVQGRFKEVVSMSMTTESPTTGTLSASNSETTNTETTEESPLPHKPVSNTVIAIVLVLLTVIALPTSFGITVWLVRRRRRAKIEVSAHDPTQISYYEELPPHAFTCSSHNNGTPAVNQSSLNDKATTDQGISMYMTAQELDLKSTTQQPGLSDTTVVYSEVPKHLNQKNLIYEHVDVKPASKIQSVDDQFTVVYSDIKTVAEQATTVHTVAQPENNQQPCVQNALSDENSFTTTPQPFTRDNLLTALSPLTHKWRELGLQLDHGIDEDRIDEFDTNNETDEACLETMMDYYFTNVHFEHTWEEICKALKEIGEEGLAEKIQNN